MSIPSITRKLIVSQSPRLLGLETFSSSDLWTPSGRSLVFGGQVVAQAMMAASHTTEKEVHSQHCYFLLPARSSEPITYTVERLRDGKSYSTRLVHAIQNSRTIFILMASFSVPPRPLDAPDQSRGPPSTHEEHPGKTETLKFDVPNVGYSIVPKLYPPRPFIPHYHQPAPKDVTPWNMAPLEEDHWKEFLAEAKHQGVDLGKRSEAVQDYIDERLSSPISIAIARQQTGDWGSRRAVWLKPRIADGEVLDTNTIRSLFGFMTDFQFIGTAARAVGLSGTSSPRLGMIASIDHSMHFYPLPSNFDPSAPLLHVMEAEAVDVPAGRGFSRGTLYTEDGELVATTSQEGALRAAQGGKPSPPGTPVSL